MNPFQEFRERFNEQVPEYLHMSVESLSMIYSVLVFLVILLAAWISNFLVKRFVLRFTRSLTEKTKTKIGKYLLEERFFHRLAHLAPAFVISALSAVAFTDSPTLGSLIEKMVNLYLVLIGLWVIDAVINTGLKLYQHSELSEKLALKGICQAAKIVINASGLIFILSILLDKSPLYFFSGLGALTAILLLVFKDSILGLVAGIQLSLNKMVRLGDWIEMPKYGADGDVI
ncbi:MAG: mechanosensitive ion channel domain-containing protein, partial [Verrucomicrobiota bacterium]|nr:mechanosensitive ion channel domain-containing protein [Verrucomicrobiota bacterium]